METLWLLCEHVYDRLELVEAVTLCGAGSGLFAVSASARLVESPDLCWPVRTDEQWRALEFFLARGPPLCHHVGTDGALMIRSFEVGECCLAVYLLGRNAFWCDTSLDLSYPVMAFASLRKASEFAHANQGYLKSRKCFY
jgi:hypothetical protein